ncbi:HAD-IIB family hydrolase [Psychrobacillus sp. FJAT-21963]|uniref:HAD-IIB family hydrolase n=1 Tax=Psychrobacillus sp. FJAT-21963 TaxID=1712028 RepID=UPI0006FFCB00|nr:HAD-IIB family hydrolase [Psychrobacillus sp. FJAT-21963]KQL33661.1 HAD family hydrolase [Psychrobacillus sp. FJAT-21963]
MKLVFDLDGTVCFKGQPISNRILLSLSQLREAGIEVIFASARPIRDMLPVIDEAFHHYTMIGGNGSLISKGGKVIKSNSFSTNEINEIKNLINQYNATYLIDGDWDYAYTGPDTHPILQNLDPAKLATKVSLESLDSVVKVLLLTSNSMDELAEKLSKLNVYVNKHSKENVLDISPSGINKWSALKTLGIKENTYIAFGNDANDISMFENALHTVMIGYHEDLAPFAKETISLSGDYEQEIAEKILTLSKEYRSIQV